MKKRTGAIFGLIAPLIGFISVGISIAISPWFSWKRNALSDLGHPIRSNAAPIFNFGLLLTGILLIIYIVIVLKDHLKWTSHSLLLSAFLLQTVAMFDEIYGILHFIVSILFFISLGISSFFYALEKKSYLAIASLIIGIFSWIFYLIKIFDMGIAVPEIISSFAVASWIMTSAFQIYKKK
jgi:hypothetical membrane protein